MGGRLCPWSRCLTWAKPAKQPPCLGRSPGCKSGQRGQTRGTGDGRAGAVHGGDMPSKTNHQLHFFFTQNIICLSVLHLSPVSAPPAKYIQVFLPFPLHLFLLSFCLFFFFIACVHKHNIYSLSHIPLTHPPPLLTPSALSGCLSFSS